MSQHSFKYAPAPSPQAALPARMVRGFRLICTALVFLGISSQLACDEELPPQASLVLYHNLAQQGDLDILVNGDRLTYVAPGRFSSEVSVEPGLATLAIRSSGASEALAETNVDFQLQGYFFVAYKVDNEIKLLSVDEVPPPREEERHHVEVLNLLSSGSPLRYFVGQEEIEGAFGLSEREFSPFEVVNAGDAPFAISNPETGAPIKQSESFSLPEGGASLFILYEGSGDQIEIKRFTVR